MWACRKCQTPYPAGKAFCDLDGEPIVRAEAGSSPSDPSNPSDPSDSSNPSYPSYWSSPSNPSNPLGSDSWDSGVGGMSEEEYGDIQELNPSDVFEIDEIELDERVGLVMGSYRILDLIGEGGMGKVYLAEHITLGRKVAIKILRERFALKPDIVQRFFQEARAVCQIGHPNIVEVIDFVAHEGTTYFVMELLTGRDVGDLVRFEGPLPFQRTIRILIQVCEALSAAHRVGIIHRDMKPDNIFLIEWRGQKDFVKVLDFGVAKLTSGVIRDVRVEGTDETSDGNLTVVGTVVGTPAYMSPEQASGGQVDHRSDIYSIGTIMYKVFTNRTPFRASSVAEYAKAHQSIPPVPPRTYAWGTPIPKSLEDVVLKCLSKTPEHRFQSMSELGAALQGVLDSITPVGEQVAYRPLPRKRRWGWAFAAVVALALAGGAGAAWWADELPFENELGLFAGATTSKPVAKSLEKPKKEDPVEEPGADPVATTAPVPVDVVLRLRTIPSGAEVFRADDPTKVLGVTPLETSFEAVDEEVEFVFRLKDHEDRSEMVNLAANANVTVPLKKKKRAFAGRPGDKKGPAVSGTAAPKKVKTGKPVGSEVTLDPFR